MYEITYLRVKMNKSKEKAIEILSKGDIKVNGNRPWDIKINNENFYSKVLGGGALALGETYMDGWWDCDELNLFFEKLLTIYNKDPINLNLALLVFKAKINNMQSKLKAFQVGEEHYDLGNDLYEKMLDKRMVYTCGYWENAKNLDEAQENKLDLICKKLHLKKGMKVLDIGCGWGSFAKYAAENYGVEVLGITILKEQAKLAREKCKGLPIEIRVQDYREIDEKFDAIVSIGMFEHVGVKNYRKYFEIVNKCLNDGGVTLLHTIGQNYSGTTGNPWINKYIFPNGMIPSIKQIGKATENLMVMEDLHNFGPDYSKTLLEWEKKFRKNWPKLKNNYDERFYRMWRYYLLSCAGMFSLRDTQLWQIVFTKKGVRDVYKTYR